LLVLPLLLCCSFTYCRIVTTQNFSCWIYTISLFH
jgi:hypothetical protein